MYFSPSETTTTFVCAHKGRSVLRAACCMLSELKCISDGGVAYAAPYAAHTL